MEREIQKIRLLNLLRIFLDDPKADFRPGQRKIIELLLNKREKILLIQRTGWGKSIVYFLTTKILRDQNSGPTLLISPLLALMRNQILATKNIGLRADTINSSNTNQWRQVKENVLANKVDILLISPERLANSDFRKEILLPISNRVGLFVVDEAHCISDWGHDFRPDYRRIVRILQAMPPNVPILATTATANKRVIKDIWTQLGKNLHVFRGHLMREGLCLQNIKISDKACRMAWLVKHLSDIEGSGIIYVLTVKDACRVADWLKMHDIDAHAYYGALNSDERERLESALLNNRVKALVATSALGMGFDKPDISFVIHFQRPGSVVHYYQQVGRAGRAIKKSYGILLEGEEDQDITDYFIKSAFPPRAHIKEALDALEHAEDGLSITEMEREVNCSRTQIRKVMKILETETPSPVSKIEKKYYANPVEYEPDRKKIDALIRIRKEEQAKMAEYMESKQCLMEFLARELDDPHAKKCGQCAFCRGKPLIPETYDNGLVKDALTFLKRIDFILNPRKSWPRDALAEMGWTGIIDHPLRLKPGRALCMWGDAGWGESVRRGKQVDGRYSDSLVDAAVEMVLKRWHPIPFPGWVTCVPSLRHPVLVPDFARRLARRLGLKFVPCIEKVCHTTPQKLMQNSYQQAKNLLSAFRVKSWNGMDGTVLLFDDMVDSRWTLTIIGAMLRESGSGPVFPLALSTTYSK
ncbi:MAG: RecQ family ATP-dependent DNA helicase [Candidatus Eremiobacteraeota bacterium]|nr:RecQ family ATP-dependent DNA helicase [Candidatus Eremiobacteraeota bacterium]